MNGKNSGGNTGSLFACIFPGRPLTTEFKQVAKSRFILNVPNPAQIREFSISLLKPVLPKDHGATIYFSLPPFKDWQYVGSISMGKPSQIYNAPWRGTLPSFLESCYTDGLTVLENQENVKGLQIGISIETLKFIENLHPQAQHEERKKLISSVQGVANDLFQYLQSFARTTQGGEMIVMPVKKLDLWLKKFEAKHKKDPYFWLKKT